MDELRRLNLVLESTRHTGRDREIAIYCTRMEAENEEKKIQPTNGIYAIYESPT